MAYENYEECGTFPASTGLKQYQFVALNSNGRLINPTTEGNYLGVITSSGTTGSTGRAGSTDSGSVQTVQFYGVAKVLAGTTGITYGTLVKASTDGRGSTAASSTSCLAGISLGTVNTTSTISQVIPVLLRTGHII